MNNSPPRTNSAPSQTTSILASARLYHPVWPLARARQVRHEFKLRHYPLLAFGDQQALFASHFLAALKLWVGRPTCSHATRPGVLASERGHYQARRITVKHREAARRGSQIGGPCRTVFS